MPTLCILGHPYVGLESCTWPLRLFFEAYELCAYVLCGNTNGGICPVCLVVSTCLLILPGDAAATRRWTKPYPCLDSPPLYRLVVGGIMIGPKYSAIIP